MKTEAPIDSASPRPPDRSHSELRVAGAAQAFALIFLSGLPTMAITSLIPNLPLLFHRFGRTPHADWLVPMVLTIPSLCIALLSPLIGMLSDRWGRRPVLLGSLVVFVTVGLLPLFMHDLVAVLWTRIPVGVAEAGIVSTQNALLGDYFEGEPRRKWLGVLSVINPLIAIVFVLAGGALGDIGWRAPFLLYSLGVPMFLWAALALYEPRRTAKTAGGAQIAPVAFPWRNALLVGLVTLAVSLLYYVQAVQLGRIFGELGVTAPGRNGVFVTISSAGVVLGGWAYPRTGKLSARSRFLVVLIAYTIGYAGLGSARSMSAALPISWISEFGSGMAIPTMIDWALSRFDVDHRGAGMGIWGGCFFAGTFLSPPFVTAIQSFSGSFLSAVRWVGAIAGIAAFAVLAVRARRAGSGMIGA